MFPSPLQRIFRGAVIVPRNLGVMFLAVCIGGPSVIFRGETPTPNYWTVVTLSFLAFLCACLWATRPRIMIHNEGISSKSLIKETDLYWNEITETRYRQQAITAFGDAAWIQRLRHRERCALWNAGCW